MPTSASPTLADAAPARSEAAEPLPARSIPAEAPPALPSLDERRLALDRERHLLDQRRVALDESWPRKWGGVLLSAAATVSVAIITAGLSITQNYRAQAEADRVAADAERQRNVENDRTALDMYFRYVADKPDNQPYKPDHIQLLESIASNRRILDRLNVQQTRAALDHRQDLAPSAVLAGLPDLAPQRAGHVYVPQDFTGYVQFVADRAADAGRVADALRSLGMRIPGLQAVGADKAPDHNEIRIYRTAHRPAAERLAAWLQRSTGLAFAVRAIGGNTLPNGIVEIWIGHS